MNRSIYLNFAETSARYPDKTALLYKKEGKYRKISFKGLQANVIRLASALRRAGIEKGDAVGIFSYNRPEWVIADLAIMKLGAVVVPVYHTLTSSYLRYIIKDAKVKLIFVENDRLFPIIEEIWGDIPFHFKVVVFDTAQISTNKNFWTFRQMLNLDSPVTRDSSTICGNDTATIVYTSGTTGEPKGVVLSHHNILSNALAARDRFKITFKDVIFSILPLSHLFERTCGYYAILLAGGAIAYARDLNTITQDIAKIRPTLIITVPRIIEKIYQLVVEKIEGGGPIKRKWVVSAIKALNRYANLTYKKQRIPPALKVKYLIYNALVASKFRKLTGGRLRLMGSGGAHLDPKIAKILYILGYNIIEGYGLTEASPLVCSNKLEDIRLGTVGKPLDGVQVKISKQDEILVKGPNVMQGYLHKPEETKKAIDADGWLHTGDQGRFNKSGDLIITGRIKEMIITSYGKNIAPAFLEKKISGSRYIDQVMVFGDEKRCLVALIVPNKKAIQQHARELNVSYENYSELLKSNGIQTLIQQEVDQATTDLASYETIKSFAVLPESFTVNDALLTPTLKLRRIEILKRYKDQIENLYENLKRKQSNK